MLAIVFIGIQGSGKSTFYAQNFSDTHLRINLDMLGTRHREKILLQACIDAKQNLVVDNTNITRLDRTRYTKPLRAARFDVVELFERLPFAESATAGEGADP